MNRIEEEDENEDENEEEEEEREGEVLRRSELWRTGGCV